MEEVLSGTESDNTRDTAEFSQDEFDNVEVEAVDVEGSGRSNENEDDSLKPYMDEPLADEEWLASYRKKQENQKLERELTERLESRVLVEEWQVQILSSFCFIYIRVPHLSSWCFYACFFFGFLPQ